MSAAKQPRNAKAEYWQAQTADARCSRDRANAKNDLLRKQNAEMAEALLEAERMVDAQYRNNPMPDDLAALGRIRAVLAKAGL